MYLRAPSTVTTCAMVTCPPRLIVASDSGFIRSYLIGMSTHLLAKVEYPASAAAGTIRMDPMRAHPVALVPEHEGGPDDVLVLAAQFAAQLPDLLQFRAREADLDLAPFDRVG